MQEQGFQQNSGVWPLCASVSPFFLISKSSGALLVVWRWLGELQGGSTWEGLGRAEDGFQAWEEQINHLLCVLGTAVWSPFRRLAVRTLHPCTDTKAVACHVPSAHWRGAGVATEQAGAPGPSVPSGFAGWNLEARTFGQSPKRPSDLNGFVSPG